MRSPSSGCTRSGRFQFHKGTIRTFLNLNKTSETSPKFQFHKGTIRTQVEKYKQNVKTNFNSIKVRLEPRMVLYAYITMILFQFHKGTIRTQIKEEADYTVNNFNSIKVRLEQTEGMT